MSRIDALGTRMKAHESVSSHRLVRRIPVIVRVDGRAFHTWTRGAQKPFDPGIVRAMWDATVELAHEMQGCRLAYVQSDEASFLLTDWATLETEPWFGYELSKVLPIAASTMTAAFNVSAAQCTHTQRPAMFDARAFNLPLDDVANYFLWRAKDWRRNSVLSLAQAHFSPKQLHGVNKDLALAMLMERGVDWRELPSNLRCGSFYFPKQKEQRADVEPHYPEIAPLLEFALSGGME